MLNRVTTATALLALTTSLALAQATAPGGTEPKAGASAGTSPGSSAAATQAGKDMKEWQVAKLAKVGLAEALATAEAKGGENGEEKGGRAIEADFERADGKNPAHYSIKVVYPSGKLVEYGINADTGELYKSENQPIERYFTRLKPSDFQNAKTSLKDAIGLAEQKAGGKAYEAEVERDGSTVQYEIEVALVDGAKEVKVGPDGTVAD